MATGGTEADDPGTELLALVLSPSQFFRFFILDLNDLIEACEMDCIFVLVEIQNLYSASLQRLGKSSDEGVWRSITGCVGTTEIYLRTNHVHMEALNTLSHHIVNHIVSSLY